MTCEESRFAAEALFYLLYNRIGDPIGVATGTKHSDCEDGSP